MFSKNSYFTIDDNQGLPQFNAFKLHASQQYNNTYFSDWLVNDLVSDYRQSCQDAKAWSAYNLDNSRKLFERASHIDNTISWLLNWDIQAQEYTLEYALYIMSTRALAQ